jgi:carbamoyl-phosphate synthase large subunit
MYSTYEGELARPRRADRPATRSSSSAAARTASARASSSTIAASTPLALREAGFETIMVNCNPETVSTDYDTSDRLYFEPLTLEDVLEIVDRRAAKRGLGDRAVRRPDAAEAGASAAKAGVPILGTSPDCDRPRRGPRALPAADHKLGLLPAAEPHRAPRRPWRRAPPSATRSWCARATCSAAAPWRSSTDAGLSRYMRDAVKVSNDSPVLLDRFLDNAVEVDVDCGGSATGEVLIGGIMEHIEEAGVHSGDSSCSLPPYSLSPEIQDRLREQVRAMARRLKVVGLMNTQFAIQGDTIYVLEVNPRASRTVPFVAKATGMALAKIGARCMDGNLVARAGCDARASCPVLLGEGSDLPVRKFQNVDPILGPEMRSTGEVMGVGRSFGAAFARAQEAANIKVPPVGKAFVSVRDPDKQRLLPVAKDLLARGFGLVATGGTATFLQEQGLPCDRVNKVLEGRPHVVDLIKNGEIVYIVNTTEGRQAIADSFSIRREALQHRVTYSTTVSGARALVHSLDWRGAGDVLSLQELHGEL